MSIVEPENAVAMLSERYEVGTKFEHLYRQGNYNYVGITEGERKTLVVVGPRGGVQDVFSFGPEMAKQTALWLL